MTNETVVELAAADLLRGGDVCCPNPKAGMKQWNGHPRVYLNMAHAESGQVRCPYCGTLYRLKAGEAVERRH
ncbi:MAG: zinc-finger domain-containing protein [Burkholderiaceae bacterium]|nr:zinc-finger domain-containing protein [Burkholderiaceae bacterium]